MEGQRIKLGALNEGKVKGRRCVRGGAGRGARGTCKDLCKEDGGV